MAEPLTTFRQPGGFPAKPRDLELTPDAQRVANGMRAGVLSAAVHHALGALKMGRIAEAIAVLEDVV